MFMNTKAIEALEKVKSAPTETIPVVGLVLLGICSIALLYCFILLIRNGIVYNERMRVIHLMSELSNKDINNHKSWMWRHKEFDKITYDEMVFKFWIPVRKFYENNPCLK
jgi:hypothetical protein